MTRVKLGKGTTELYALPTHTVTRKCNMYRKNELLLDNTKKWNVPRSE